MNKLVCFDFDGTLCDTKDMVDGRIIWEDKNRRKWPYRGWWGRVESLDWETFQTKTIDWVYQNYLEDKKNSDFIILATGRLNSVPGMRDSVEKILNMNSLSFSQIEIDGEKSNGVFLNPGVDTFKFKTHLFEYLIDKLHITDFTMYDDRSEHLSRFVDWAQNQKIDIQIIDVVNRTTQTFKNKKI